MPEPPLESSRTSKQPGHLLSGWAGIEDHLIKHDILKVNDYMNDIDTLLVFAGLFSSVLTAFAVQTYEMLQPDNMTTTNQLLALGFSSQLIDIPQAFQATLNSARSPVPFSPPITARWINGLFFVSLVLSLAAALFGIIAKQWLREYLQWNSPLSSPRENVLVRQIRFEAFNTWNVASTISAIPALLELAVILFLVGTVMLLWTLDNIVASCVTFIVIVYLAVVSAFTILPILYKRCPYKSPTAWACVAGYHVISSPIVFYYKYLKSRTRLFHSRWKYLSAFNASFVSRCRDVIFGDAPTYGSTVPKCTTPHIRPRSWREWDLESCRVTTLLARRWWQSSVHAQTAAKLELSRELIPLVEGGAYARDPDVNIVDDDVADALLLDISETSLLVRALSWVQQASQDPQVEKYIQECIGSVNKQLPVSFAGPLSRVQTITNWCILASVKGAYLANPHLALSPSLSKNRSSSGSTVTTMRRASGVRSLPKALSPGYTLYSNVLNLERAGLQLVLERSLSCTENLVLRLMHTSFRTCLTELGSMEDDSEIRMQASVRRLFESFNLLNRIGTERSMVGEDWYLDVLLSILGTKSLKPRLAVHAPTLYIGAFQLACQYARVTFDKSEDKLAISRGTTGFEQYESLLAEYFGENPTTYSDDEVDLFVVAALGWLHHLRPTEPSSPDGSTEIILKKMGGVAQAILDRGGRTFCGSELDDVVWTMALWRNKSFLALRYGPLFRQLLHSFDLMFRGGILMGGTDVVKQYLLWNLEEAHRGIEACSAQPDCHWISHKCKAWECSALPDYAKASSAPESPLRLGRLQVRVPCSTVSEASSPTSPSPPPSSESLNVGTTLNERGGFWWCIRWLQNSVVRKVWDRRSGAVNDGEKAIVTE